jgi:CheY-like chemotaxis protein
MLIIPLRVLVVEDDDDHRQLLRMMLRQSGVIVAAVGTVDEAIWEIEDFIPDVIVSDLVMPERDGFDLMEALRSRAIPVVAVSGADFHALARRVRLTGFAAFLPKPVSAARLVETVRNVIPRRLAAFPKVRDGKGQ